MNPFKNLCKPASIFFWVTLVYVIIKTFFNALLYFQEKKMNPSISYLLIGGDLSLYLASRIIFIYLYTWLIQSSCKSYERRKNNEPGAIRKILYKIPLIEKFFNFIDSLISRWFFFWFAVALFGLMVLYFIYYVIRYKLLKSEQN